MLHLILILGPIVKLSTKILVLLLSLIINGYGQNNPLVLRSFVKEDTVLLRWAPITADIMIKGLKNGYQVDRIATISCPAGEPLNKTFYIASFDEKRDAFANATDENIRRLAGLIDEITNATNLPDETKKMAFSILMLAAATDKEIAKMMGVYYEDVGCPQDYQYRVQVRNSNETSGMVSVNSTIPSEHQLFTTLTGSARPKLKQAYLSWEAKTLQEGYSAYWIERSTDSIHFEKRNTVPYLFLRSADEPNKTLCDFVDTSVCEGMTYYYRVCGISHFAERGHCSNTVKVYIPRSLHGECRIDTISANGFMREVRGKFVPRNGTSSSTSGGLTQFVLMRSDSLQAGYEVLLKQENASGFFNFTVAVPLESGDRYYYKVAVLSADNDTVYSFPYYFFTLDQIPPSMPQNLSGSVNDSGIVLLTWSKNPEADIRGYRIFRTNALHEEFIEVTTAYCTTANFKDTLPLDNLTSTVYYRLVAVDFNFNNSESCAPILLMKPDTIPPVSGVFLEYTVQPNGVFLRWVNSSSQDVVQNNLVRFYNNRADTLFTWADTVQIFTDTTGTPGSTYSYALITHDKSGNSSHSMPLAVNYETGNRPAISGLCAVTDRAQKQVSVSWNLPATRIYAIQVYRSKNEEAFRLVKTIRDKTATSFIDKDLNINNTYHYKIKVVYESGLSSVMSAEVSVVY
jgi:uncharacterized protein